MAPKTLFDVRSYDPRKLDDWNADVPLDVKRELMLVARDHTLSFDYLCAIYRKGRADADTLFREAQKAEGAQPCGHGWHWGAKCDDPSKAETGPNELSLPGSGNSETPKHSDSTRRSAAPKDSSSIFREADAPAPSSGWQPIETAPKDGTDVLAYLGQYGDGRTRLVFWDEPNGGRWSIWPGRDKCEPTHWMPLPAPPVVLDSRRPGEG